jgi:hypothetical protein
MLCSTYFSDTRNIYIYIFASTMIAPRLTSEKRGMKEDNVQPSFIIDSFVFSLFNFDIDNVPHCINSVSSELYGSKSYYCTKVFSGVNKKDKYTSYYREIKPEKCEKNKAAFDPSCLALCSKITLEEEEVEKTLFALLLLAWKSHFI